MMAARTGGTPLGCSGTGALSDPNASLTVDR